MTILEQLRHNSAEAQARAKLAEHESLIAADKERQAKQAADDAAARTAAEPFIEAVKAKMAEASTGNLWRADVYDVPAGDCLALPLQDLDRKDPRAFTGATRGLALWALDNQLRFEVRDRDNGEWTWRDRDPSKGMFNHFKEKKPGYKEWLVLEISWEHQPTGESSKRQTDQRQSAKYVGFGAFLDLLTLHIRKKAAEPGVTADQRMDIEHHIRWTKKIKWDDTETMAISLIAAANALGIKLEDLLAK